MKKKIEITFNDIKLDSNEEFEFMLWLDEARTYGFIKKYSYHPAPFVLLPRQAIDIPVMQKLTKTGGGEIKYKEKFLFHPHTYQPDFIIEITDKFMQSFPEALTNYNLDPYEYYIDVKGAYKGSRLMSDQKFPINQKLVWHFHKIYINKVTLVDFFTKTFVPFRCAFMKNRRVLTRRKAYEKCRLLTDDIVKGINT